MLVERIEAGRVAEELAAKCRSSHGTAGSAGEGMHGPLEGWISEEQARTFLRIAGSG